MIDIIDNDICYLHLYLKEQETSVILQQTTDGYKLTICTDEENTEQIQLNNEMLLR